MDLGGWGRGKEKRPGKDKYWLLHQWKSVFKVYLHPNKEVSVQTPEEGHSRAPQQRGLWMETPGPGMQLCVRTMTDWGPKSLTATPSRDCSVLTGCYQVWGREGSFPARPAKQSLCNCLWLDLKDHSLVLGLEHDPQSAYLHPTPFSEGVTVCNMVKFFCNMAKFFCHSLNSLLRSPNLLEIFKQFLKICIH